jgi:SulP family sulfate permease
MYVLGVAGVFWAVVAGTGQANAVGMAELASQGWLFNVEASIREQHGIGEAWIYWRLFDFSKTEWHAMKDATLNIVLLVVIGVFNLPIYVPALALALDIPSYR